MSKSEYIVRKIEYPDFNLWDNMVKSSPQGSVFHLSNWIKTCADSQNQNYILFGVYKNQGLIAGLPLIIKKYKGVLKYGTSSISLTPFGGFLLPETSSTKVREKEQRSNQIIKVVLSEVNKEKLLRIQITNSPDLYDIRPFTWNKWKAEVYYSYILNLNQDIWINISKKTRNIIRKGQKNSISTEICWDTELYWQLNIDTYSKQGKKPPFSKDYLISLMNLIKEKNFGEMWIAKMPDGNIASAEIILWDNRMAYRWSAASCNEYKNTGATSFLLYTIFENLKERGFSKINLMAANTPNLTQFISSFNPELVPYYEITKEKLIGYHR
ncbi:MAG: GNAT family N-acetyltransferase [Methanogenium sp.]|nr:GNAT family N-acetyltransferase [Methanogenium sp.]